MMWIELNLATEGLTKVWNEIASQLYQQAGTQQQQGSSTQDTTETRVNLVKRKRRMHLMK